MGKLSERCEYTVKGHQSITTHVHTNGQCILDKLPIRTCLLEVGGKWENSETHTQTVTRARVRTGDAGAVPQDLVRQSDLDTASCLNVPNGYVSSTVEWYRRLRFVSCMCQNVVSTINIVYL